MKYYLRINSLYIQVKEKEFNTMIDKISEDYIIQQRNNSYFIIYYAIDDEIPFAEPEEIGYVRTTEEV